MAPAANSHEDLTGDTEAAETDAGPGRAGGKGVADTAPSRRCIVTMETKPQDLMIRFVLGPDRSVVPDLAARLPGRGAWVTAAAEAVDAAAKKGVFARAFKAPAKASPDLAPDVEKLLAKRALEQLGLARRAGELILGFEQVREAIRDAAPACLIEASDGAEDGRSKVLALLHGLHGSGPSSEGERPENRELPPVVGCFSADELGMALGRGRVIHACLKQGRFARSWMGELARLSGFRRVWLKDGLPFGDRPETDAKPNGPGAKN
ncbi:MAG TPA: RNA-binding protein [Hyphomonadaceae bacterium]|nr:RNA-binding protein [Hyphomonadaceae bacterium]